MVATPEPVPGDRESSREAKSPADRFSTWGLPMTLADIAIPGVETAGPDTAVDVLADTMSEQGVGSVVIEEDRRPVGIVTDRDIALAVAEEPNLSSLTAAAIMTPDPRTMNSNEGVLDLTTVMCQEEVRRMPIVDDAGEIVGIITFDDLVRLLVTELDNLAGVVVAESPPT